MAREEKVYLGDGAYYEFDGESVKLSTSNGVRTTNQIYLGPSEIVALLRALGEDFNVAKLHDQLHAWLAKPKR